MAGVFRLYGVFFLKYDKSYLNDKRRFLYFLLITTDCFLERSEKFLPETLLKLII